MWTHELVFEHLDGGLDTGTVTETLLFEYCQKDFEDLDRIAEITDFELWLAGMRFETALRDGENFQVYLSAKDDDDEKTLHCYCIQYGLETTRTRIYINRSKSNAIRT